MDNLTTFISSIPPEAYYAIGSAVGVSIVLQFLKKWLSLQSDKIIHFILVSLSFAAVSAEYIMNTISQNPTILGSQTFVVLGLATTVYRYVIKPASTFMAEVKDLKAQKAILDANGVTTTLTSTAPVAAATTYQLISDSKVDEPVIGADLQYEPTPVSDEFAA